MAGTAPLKQPPVWHLTQPDHSEEEAVLRNLLGRRSKTSAVVAIEAGLPISALDRLQAALSISRAELADCLLIPVRTLSRRHILTFAESDRLFRISRLFHRTVEVMGEVGAARRWLLSSKVAFHGDTPLEHSRTEVGSRQVETLLGQIEHGVFA